ncbi:MAG: undecaprenyl diphosphate synthase [bacterium]|jgi:undecaprenyl diphosphate synthase
MDGNGRWAKKKKLPRVFGHRNAIKAVRETVETCAEIGIEVLTLYAFSTENWSRPEDEVSFLMKLFEEFLQKELKTMLKNNVQFNVIGRREQLPSFIKNPLDHAIQQTKDNAGLKLRVAINYGSRDEIVDAVQAIGQKLVNQEITTTDINEELITNHLFTKGLCDPDLIIRTSGEMRLSNFLMWQAAYSEFYFTDLLWPDFRKKHLFQALEEYSERVRRMGNV